MMSLLYHEPRHWTAPSEKQRPSQTQQSVSEGTESHHDLQKPLRGSCLQNHGDGEYFAIDMEKLNKSV